MSERADGLTVYRVLSAVLLGLAAVTTGWAAYEGAVWTGQRSLHQALAGREDRQAEELTLEANQERVIDVMILHAFVDARLHGDERAAAFYRAHFRPELAQAVDVWLETRPFKHPTESRGGLHMPRYEVPQEVESRRHKARAAVELQDVLRADSISASYVLGTVIAAFVGLFAGLSETSTSRKMRRFLTLFAGGVYVVAVVWIVTRPVALTGTGFTLPPPAPETSAGPAVTDR
jgi:hypothetical protein